MKTPDGEIREAILRRLGDLGTWRAVGRDLGINPGLAWNVAHGRRRASRPLRMALGLVHPPKPRINWRRKERLLRMWIRRDRAGQFAGHR